MNNQIVIKVEDLRKQFPVGLGVRKRLGLDGMSLQVNQGEIYGFLGPNGAGKTTTIKILTSLLRQDSGEALIFGEPPWRPAARKRLGFLPESPVFYDHLTGREFLHFCGTLTGLSGAALSARATELIGQVGLESAGDLQIRRYSKGMTQRIGIAQAIIHNPDLVILDEPMSGLDPMGRADVRDIIVKLRDQGKTIFFSTHIIPDVEAICQRVGIVAKGKLIRVGTVRELMSEGSTGTVEILANNVPSTFQMAGVSESQVSEGQKLFTVAVGDSVNQTLAELIKQGGTIVSVVPRQASLEDLVVRLLEKEEAS